VISGDFGRSNDASVTSKAKEWVAHVTLNIMLVPPILINFDNFLVKYPARNSAARKTVHQDTNTRNLILALIAVVGALCSLFWGDQYDVLQNHGIRTG
jgi:hypothetical protein